MKRILGLLFTLPLCLLAGNKHNWKTGKVLDSEAAKTYLQSGASTTSSAFGTAYSSGVVTSSGSGTANYSGVTTASANGTAETQIHNIAIQSTRLLIVGEEYAYVVEDNVEKAVGPRLQGSLARAIANRIAKQKARLPIRCRRFNRIRTGERQSVHSRYGRQRVQAGHRKAGTPTDPTF